MWNTLIRLAKDVISSNDKSGPGSSPKTGIIDYGESTVSGHHDHRYNKGGDRTPSQKKADNAKKKGT